MILPFVALTLTTVGLIGYISYINGKAAVDTVTLQLRLQIANQIEQHLVNFLNTPYQIDATNANLLQNKLLDPNDVRMLQTHFLEQVKLYPMITSVYFGNPQGGIVGGGREGAQGALYVYQTANFLPGGFNKYAVDLSGNPGKLLTHIDSFDARSRIWYQKAFISGERSLSDVYILSTGQDMAVATSLPVYDQQHTLIGVTSVDLFLSHLNDFLHKLEISPTGESFIIQHNGLEVANSVSEALVFTDKMDGKLQRLSAENSQNPMIQAAAVAIHQAYGDFANLPAIDQNLEFMLNGKRHFILLRPLSDDLGLEWFIVVVIPQADFMEPMQSNNLSSLLIVSLAALGTIFIGVLLAYSITRHIRQLAESASRLADDHWDRIEANTSQISEISTLAHAFNQMSRRLHESMDRLRAENMERKQAEETLRISEERYARLYVEEQMHAEELRVLNRIGQAVISDLEFDQMLQTLYEQCRTVLNIDVFYVAIYDEKTHQVYHPLLIDHGETVPIPPRDIYTAPGLSGFVINNKQTLYIPDTNAPEAVSHFQIYHTSDNQSLSYVGVPLIVHGRGVGVLSMQSYELNAYNPAEIALLEIIADRVAAAVEHSRLFAEIQANARFLELLNEITRAALEATDFSVMMQTLANRMGELFGADGCFITRWDEAEQHTFPVASYKDDSNQYHLHSFGSSEITLTASVLREGKPLAIADVYNSPYLSPRVAANFSSKSLLGLPLVAGEQKLGAALVGFDQPHEFNQQEIILGQLVATQVALTIAKSELVVMDGLTQIYNRRGLTELGNCEADRSKRYHNPLSAIFFDIDHFKQFNDLYSHEIGDQVLKNVAQFTRKYVRAFDIVGRYGGEEFVVLLPETTQSEARLLAERLLQMLATSPIPTPQGELHVTVSMGVASLSPTIQTIDSLIAAADKAMYAAKHAGRNRVAAAE